MSFSAMVTSLVYQGRLVTLHIGSTATT